MKKNLLIVAAFAMLNTVFAQNLKQISPNQTSGGNTTGLHFDGVDDYVSTPVTYSLTTWTYECWVNSPDVPSDVVGYDGPMYGMNCGIIWNHTNSQFVGCGTVQSASGMYYAASFGALGANTWYHLAATYDGSYLRSYRNGILVTEIQTDGGITSAAGTLNIGKYPPNAQFWQGVMDEARVWNVARTCEQINGSMNISLTGTEPGLVANYKFDEGVPAGNNTSITHAYNSTTLTNDGVLNGFALSGNSSNYLTGSTFSAPLQCVTETASGLAANCLTFAATNDLVKVPNSIPFTDYTIECNVLLKDLSNQNIIVATNASGTNVSASHQIKFVNGNFVHYMYDGGSKTLVSPVNVVPNQWYHVTIFVKANQFMGITVDGTTNYFAGSISTPWQLLTEFRFGGSAIGVGDFNGKLDEVRIWDRVLCAAEIQHFSNCEVTFPTTGLRSVFHFNQGVDGANNVGIDSLFADNSSVIGTLVNFDLVGNYSNWDDAGVITTGVTCGAFSGNCPANTLSFDGVNDRVTFPNFTEHSITTGTLEAWIKTSDAGASYRGIVSKVNAYGMFLNNNILTTYNWANATSYSAGPALNDNQWHHVALVFKSGVTNGSRFYIDGLPVGVNFTYTSQNQTIPLTIGSNSQATNQFFNGKIDEVRIWNMARCPSEIQANMNCKTPAGATGLVSVYHFNQGIDAGSNSSEDSLLDDSGNNLNGTLINFALASSTSNWISGSNVSSNSCNSFSTTIIQNGSTLEAAVAGVGVTYQWYDCSTGNLISGEVGMTYTPTTSGMYSVVIYNGCATISDCINFSYVGLKNVNGTNKEMLVYPNPANDKLNVKAEGKSLKVLNSLGVLVLTATLTKNAAELQVNELNPGVYHIITDMGAFTKFIKQ